jgi:hypothetical protein
MLQTIPFDCECGLDEAKSCDVLGVGGNDAFQRREHDCRYPKAVAVGTPKGLVTKRRDHLKPKRVRILRGHQVGAQRVRVKDFVGVGSVSNDQCKLAHLAAKVRPYTLLSSSCQSDGEIGIDLESHA